MDMFEAIRTVMKNYVRYTDMSETHLKTSGKYAWDMFEARRTVMKSNVHYTHN